MSQIVDDLRQVAIEIKTETQVGGNTAARVGGAFERVADALEGTQQIEDMDAAVAAVQAQAQENEQTIQDIVNNLAVVQTTGQSTSAVMSQKAVTDELNTLSSNLQDVEEEMFDATHVIKDNIFDWDVAGLPTTNNNSYITPSRTEDGARWTIKTAAPTTNRNGAVKLPSLVLGKTYCVKLAYNNALTADAHVALCKYSKGTAPGDVVLLFLRNLVILPKMSSDKVTFTFKYDVTTIQYLAFIFVQPAKNQYLEISDLIISECKSLDDLDIVDDSDAESDLDITDEQNNILARFYNGHIKTKNFDSSEWVNLTSKFKDKKFAIVGDSISTYNGWLPSSKSGYSGSTYATYYPHAGGDVQSAAQIWWYKLLVKLGITPLKWSNINVVSWSGSTVCGDSTSITNAKPACSNKRIADIGLDGFTPDIIIVFISCNDWGLDYALGTWHVSDAIPTEGNINQARAAYALMLHKIHTAYPKARVFCCTILDDIKRDRESGWPSNNNNGVTTHQWNQNIKEIAEAFGCDIIDMHACGINYQNIASLVVDEGLHPNDEGHTMMAEKVFAELIAKY